MAESKIKVDCGIIHSVYDGITQLQTNQEVYYDLFPNLEPGTYIVFITFYTYTGELLICYGSNVNNVVCECGRTGLEAGQSGAGIIHLTETTTLQLYSVLATTVYRFKAEAVKIA